MKIYHYDPVYKNFLREDNADQSPLQPNVFLIPAFSTTIKPPNCKNNEVQIFNGKEWEIREVIKPTTEEKLLKIGITLKELKEALGIK